MKPSLTPPAAAAVRESQTRGEATAAPLNGSHASVTIERRDQSPELQGTSVQGISLWRKREDPSGGMPPSAGDGPPGGGPPNDGPPGGGPPNDGPPSGGPPNDRPPGRGPPGGGANIERTLSVSRTSQKPSSGAGEESTKRDKRRREGGKMKSSATRAAETTHATHTPLTNTKAIFGPPVNFGPSSQKPTTGTPGISTRTPPRPSSHSTVPPASPSSSTKIDLTDGKDNNPLILHVM